MLENVKQALIQMPDLASFDKSNPAHTQWLGRTLALLRSVNPTEASRFDLSAHMAFGIYKETNYTQMRSILEVVIATMELNNPDETQKVYGPGAQYDFYRDLKRIIEGATKSVLIVDPYINTELFDLYVEKIRNGMHVRLLTSRIDSATKAVITKYQAKRDIVFQARSSPDIHDRVIMVDRTAIWVLGQSIKDAAKKKPTYIAPLPSDVVTLKESYYDTIWNAASTL